MGHSHPLWKTPRRGALPTRRCRIVDWEKTRGLLPIKEQPLARALTSLLLYSESRTRKRCFRKSQLLVASCTELSNTFSEQEAFDIAVDSACFAHLISGRRHDLCPRPERSSFRTIVCRLLFWYCECCSNPRRLRKEDLETIYFS